jgi:hypothetical protein
MSAPGNNCPTASPAGNWNSETEAHALATRLATASEVFPLKRTGDFDSIAIASAEGNVVTVVVTDHKSRAKREYRATIQLVAETHPEMQTAPAQCANTGTTEGHHVPTTHEESETQP